MSVAILLALGKSCNNTLLKGFIDVYFAINRKIDVSKPL